MKPTDKLGSIRLRLQLLVALPIIVLSIALNYYLTISRIDDTRALLNKEGTIISSYLASAAEFGLYTGNADVLQDLLDFTLSNRNVYRATIYDENNKVIAKKVSSRKQNYAVNDDANLEQGALVKFVKMVYAGGFNVFDYNENSPPNDTETVAGDMKLLGKVEIEFSTTAYQAQQTAIVRNSIIIILVCMVAGILLALFTEKSITRPILNLTRLVKGFGEGNLKARSAQQSSGELGTLEKGVNYMASALEKSREKMQVKIDDATKELRNTISELQDKNQQLDESRNDAMKAGKAKEEFLARMSHEIRTPMNAVIGYSRLLEKTGLDQEQKEHIKVIGQAASQLIVVIDDILNFSKLGSGAIELEKINFDIQECMEDVVGMLSPSASEKGLELVLLLHSDVPEIISGDPLRISQVLTNLINNAIKFTSRGHIVVEVEKLQTDSTDFQCDRTTENDSWIRISVEDTGIGIARNQIERLFEEFNQADPTITRRFGGTGLGLAIAKKFVEIMGGEIGVESVSGEGSKFWFTIRNYEQDSGNPEITNQDIVSFPFADKKLIVYDRNPFSSRSIRNNLLKWGGNVFTVRSITKMIKMFESIETDSGNGFDAIILGLQQEETSPALVEPMLAEIRNYYRGPVLILTGLVEYALPGNYREDRQLFYAGKPIRRQALYRKICNLLDLNDFTHHEKESPDTPVRINSKTRVLVVEDNEFNRNLFKRLLDSAGVQSDLARDAREAIEKYSAEDHALVLMDIHLPDMSGLELAPVLRQKLIGGHQVPIVALTADVFITDKDEFKNGVFDDCILKPVSEPLFWEVINKWLRSDKEIARQTEKNVYYDNVTMTIENAQRNLLKSEVLSLLDEIEDCDPMQESAIIKDRLHQIKGLLGYFGVLELEQKISYLEKAYSQLPSIQQKNELQNFKNQVSAIDDYILNC